MLIFILVTSMATCGSPETTQHFFLLYHNHNNFQKLFIASLSYNMNSRTLLDSDNFI